MKDDQSDTLAQAQALADDIWENKQAVELLNTPDKDVRRCLFGHSVPANQGFEIKAGFVCYGHSSEFDNAG